MDDSTFVFSCHFFKISLKTYLSQYHVITMVHGERNFLTKVNFLSYTLNYAKTSLVNHKKRVIINELLFMTY